jgi:hypothetical protein
MGRLNLQIAETVRQRLEALVDRSEADSMVEVIRRALAVYEVLWDVKEQGASIVVRFSDGREKDLILAP